MITAIVPRTTLTDENIALVRELMGTQPKSGKLADYMTNKEVQQALEVLGFQVPSEAQLRAMRSSLTKERPHVPSRSSLILEARVGTSNMSAQAKARWYMTERLHR